MPIDWLGRWRAGNIGWHEPRGNQFLRTWWRIPATGGRVLVPLCGKTLDLLWLAEQGHQVVGVELSPLAVEAFFVENGLDFDRSHRGPLERFTARDLPIVIDCGDYFAFSEGPFDALYDRAALVALPEDLRADYIAHTRSLLRPAATQLLITLDYDQTVVAGPPFAVPAREVRTYWPELRAVETFNAIAQSPPKFREAGLEVVTETIWRTPG